MNSDEWPRTTTVRGRWIVTTYYRPDRSWEIVIVPVEPTPVSEEAVRKIRNIIITRLKGGDA